MKWLISQKTPAERVLVCVLQKQPLKSVPILIYKENFRK